MSSGRTCKHSILTSRKSQWLLVPIPPELQISSCISMGKSPYLSHTPLWIYSEFWQIPVSWGTMRTLMDQHHSRHNSTETCTYTGQAFFLSKARGPRVISGILAGQQCHTNVNSPRDARLWWATHCAWLNHFTEGPFSQSRGCALHNTGGHITL